MRKTSNVAIALISFVLMMTMIAASFTGISFAQVTYYGDKNPLYQTGPVGHPLASEPTKRSFYNPVPAWQMYASYTGPQPAPSPWYAGASSGWARYNISNANYNMWSQAPRTAHIRWLDQYQPGGTVITQQEWGYQFRVGPLQQMSDAYSGMLAFGGYIITWLSESGGQRLQAHDEWNGQLVWETKINASLGDQPWFLLNSGGGPTIYGISGRTAIGYSLQTGNLIDIRTFPIGISMYYNSSKFSALDIGETGLYSPSGVVYGSSGGYAYCYSWANPNQKLWGPTFAPGGVSCLEADVLLGASQQLGVASGIDAITGELLWTNAEVGGSQSTQAGGYGMFYVPCSDGSIHAFDVTTGDLIWINRNITASYWNEFFMNVGDGKVLDCNRDGNIYCLDAYTGNFLWSFFAGPAPYNPYRDYYGVYGFHIVGVGGGYPGIGGGVYYAATGDESIGTTPAVPGQYVYAIDMETGDLLFKYPSGAYSHNQIGLVADGLAVLYNPVYGHVMCFGKGNTKIDLSTTSSQIGAGGYTYITGRITDQSPSQPDTPCVSADSMEAWMTYIHGGFSAPPPGIIKGVTVSLVAIDSANNVIDLGNVTSDSQGYFKLKWTPANKEEIYQIAASFSEDESYYSSYAVTNLAVDPAVASASSGSPITFDTTTTTVTLAAFAVAVATTTVSVVALLKLRKIKGGDKQ